MKYGSIECCQMMELEFYIGKVVLIINVYYISNFSIFNWSLNWTNCMKVCVMNFITLRLLFHLKVRSLAKELKNIRITFTEPIKYSIGRYYIEAISKLIILNIKCLMIDGLPRGLSWLISWTNSCHNYWWPRYFSQKRLFRGELIEET